MAPHHHQVIDLVQGNLLKMPVPGDDERRFCRFQVGTKPSHNMPWIPHEELLSKKRPGPFARRNEYGQPSTSIHRFPVQSPILRGKTSFFQKEDSLFPAPVFLSIREDTKAGTLE